MPGTKYVVGGGPLLSTLKRRYPEVRFVGPRDGEELAAYFAAADVFVFPSRTDTFGLVMLEALASGVPVAAFPVPGPLDVIGDSDIGVLDEDLGRAASRALEIDPARCRDFALAHSWQAAAHQFLSNVHPCIPDTKAACPPPAEAVCDVAGSGQSAAGALSAPAPACRPRRCGTFR